METKNFSRWCATVLMAATVVTTGCGGSDSDVLTVPMLTAKSALVKAGDAGKFADYYMQGVNKISFQLKVMRPGIIIVNDVASAVAANSNAPVTQAGFGQSSTNLIEAGVDESDVMKQNATHLYTWDDSTTEYRADHQSQLSTLKLNVFAKPGAEKVNTVELQGVSPQGIFLTDKNLVALSTRSYPQWFGRIRGWAWGVSQNGKAQLDLMNLENPAQPQAALHFEWEGDIVASRRVGDALYVVTQSSIAMKNFDWIFDIAPVLMTVPIAGDIAIDPTGVTPAPEVDPALKSTDLADRMPVGVDGQRVKPGDCYIPQSMDADKINPSIVLITKIDLSQKTAPQTTCVAASTQQVYVSPTAIYLIGGENWSAQTTSFHKFSIKDSSVQYRASGEVSGGIIWNSPAFSMNEYNDTFRIVTSTFNWAENTGQTIINQLYVLKESVTDLGAFETLSQLPNKTQPASIGKPNERIMGVRFFGQQAYIVTFLSKDPLYKIDLKDPNQPRIAGELVLPGYSAYLQQIAPGFLMGIGYAIDEATNRQTGIQVSIFNTTSDNPVLVVQDSYASAVKDATWDYIYLPLAHDSHAIMTISNGSTQRVMLPFNHSWAKSDYTTWNSSTKALQYELNQATGALLRVAETEISPDQGWWGKQRGMLDGNTIYFNLPQGKILVRNWAD